MSGFSVIVDAAFLRRDERLKFQTLAKSLGVAFVILHVDSDERLIVERLKHRHTLARDPSDADEAVYNALKVLNEPLEADEHEFVIPCWNNRDSFQHESFVTLWQRLASMTGLKSFDER
jgi:predicted kinase